MKNQILNVLMNHQGTYITGGELSKRLGVSRQSIWKHVQGLIDDGYQIQSQHRKGYQLVIEEDLAKTSLMKLVESSSLLTEHFYFDTIDSTNLYLKTQSANLTSAIAVSEEQTAGRGRLGRQWQSEKTTGLWFSMLLRPSIPPHQAAMLTQIASTAMRRAIVSETNIDCQIKWPNDLVCEGHKICGILTEMTSEMGAVQYVVIGVGLNANQQSFSPDIAEIATSLYQISGVKQNRLAILRAFIESFEQLYQAFLEIGDLKAITTELNEYSSVVGQQIWVIRAEDKYSAKASHINERGELIIIDEFGNEQALYYGEISVRTI